MAGATSDGNQRVTNALIQQDIRHLAEKLTRWRDEDKEYRQRNDDRLATVEQHSIQCATLWEKHGGEHARVDKEIDGLRADMKRWASGGGLAGAIAGGILMILGNK